ncbi:hypothetical protein PSQ90_07435 [Devosia rhodophyticola]|uniref:Uncharacterized protein n=2 Tax=Devosia rhodophyticola TaxID=3026423 RepID=A0ABY7Z324_9HYPH|nr:hypothetical protein PSQ90_07435 [Devosia rhodophyticola]
MRSVLTEERDALDRAASRLADQIAADRLVHVFGPGALQPGHPGNFFPGRRAHAHLRHSR